MSDDEFPDVPHLVLAERCVIGQNITNSLPKANNDCFLLDYLVENNVYLIPTVQDANHIRHHFLRQKTVFLAIMMLEN